MSTKETSKSHELWKVSEAASLLAGQACTVSARHINDGMLRLQFNREVAYYATSIIRDVEQGDKTVEQGLKAIQDEQESLLSQSFEIGQKGIGLIAGGLQVAGGVGVCYASMGTLCLLFGGSLIAHGTNNVYENGRNLITGRSDTEGPLRKGYQKLARISGYDDCVGNVVYGSVDILLSVYGAGRLVLKPDSWRLFKYIHTDYIRAYKITPIRVVAVDLISDGITIDSIIDQWRCQND
ncbi:hypothetical protein PSCICN_03520 [Pseudomonas cichorii]|uniref:DUF4225 domain-containing protein n=1 Tax=Pseudomonas cichorii TaxID=36746 RepID=UPI001A0538B8|nr:DUF4225 domain-containing protein [Pseudomonas cichorii]GFM79660.1 hypothetical protein PSCICN_03520 [Pseudomonas cichorii]